MKVMIVDQNAPRFQVLGRMDAVAGMRSTSGNEIKSVNGTSCQVQIEGRLQRKTEVCIDLKTALEFGWAQPRAVIQKKSRAKTALARNAAVTTQRKERVKK